MNECSFEWLRAEHYPSDHVINTDNKTVEQIVGEIGNIIEKDDALFRTL